jgi:hypothetical protein
MNVNGLYYLGKFHHDRTLFSPKPWKSWFIFGKCNYQKPSIISTIINQKLTIITNH